MSDAPKTLSERRAELEKRRADREAKVQANREEQEVSDREAIDALEEEKGITIHVSQPTRNFAPGVPVVVGVRAPSDAEYKRYFTQVNRSQGHADAKLAAHKMLAEVCWVYPTDPKVRAAMIETNAGLLASVGNFATKLAEVAMEEEGKG